MKTTRVILLLGLILLCMNACSLSARIKRADKRFAIGEYYDAGEQYRQLYRKISSKDKPMRAYVAFQQGGLTYEYGKLGVMTAVENLLK